MFKWLLVDVNIVYMPLISLSNCHANRHTKEILQVRETLRSIRISQLAKIPTLYRDWQISFK